MHQDAPPLSATDRVAADQYLRDVALTVPPPSTLTDEQRTWKDWVERWSLPLTDVTDQHLQAFLDDDESFRLEASGVSLPPAALRGLEPLCAPRSRTRTSGG